MNGPDDGRARPTPTRSARPWVKYSPDGEEAEESAGGSRLDEDNNGDEGEGPVESAPHAEDRQGNGRPLDLDGDDDKVVEDGFVKEIEHLRRRARNVQTSLQTSRGLSNPRKWRTNCLFPAMKVVREWRSILMFHSLVAEGVVGDHPNDGGEVDHDDVHIGVNQRGDLLRAASQEVFRLIQISMQTGPLVGSNPGYFKRCGGEVASIAFEFLSGIIELAGIEERVLRWVDIDGDGARQGDLTELSTLEDKRGECRLRLVASPDDDGNENSSSTLAAASVDASLRSNGKCVGFACGNTMGDTGRVCGARAPDGLASPSPSISQSPMIENLQSSLLFTERQSQRFSRWLRDAERATVRGGLPSKSATKLQGQKSKKQRQKELRMERKMKKRDGSK